MPPVELWMSGGRHGRRSTWPGMWRAILAFPYAVRLFWNVAGTIFLAIGIAGVILPLLPGTVFLIAASACYLRGSERLHSWLMNHPVLGRHLRAVREGMPMRAKVIALLMMWTAIGFSLTRIPVLAGQATFVVLGAIGTFFIVRQPSPGRIRPE